MKSTQAFFSLFFLLFLASSVALSGTNSPYDKCARGVGAHANLGKKAKQQQSIDQLKGKPRLPHFAIPRHYNLFLKPNLTTCGFAGEVQITVDVVDYTRFLVLNSVDLAIQNNGVWFKAQDSKVKLRPAEVVLEKEDEILVLRFDEYLPTGSGILSIRFTGALNDDMKGFYRSVYEYEGEKRNMAVTQFQPADARRCFPCWDEPAFKAKFKMTLEVPSELVALSNMPVAEEKINGPVKTLCFQESPLMSTYLVAVVVGMLDYVEGSLPRGLKVRVYCPVGKASQGKLALDVAVKALEFYDKYFDVPYSLPKLDMVAIADFDHGAMENYGLVTFREKYLLYDENKSTASTKQWVVIVAAHELAHQWFGNLVTMEWWSHLWLNEGFATWMSYLVGDIIFPEWKLWTQFLEQTSIALGSDALAESHPIQADINYVNETEQRFDSISYQKAASVIRMVHNYLGADSFQRSLVSYIKRFAHSNAKTEDLLAALEVGGEPVISLMNSWTKQKGFPVVSVELDGNSLKFEQSQFLASGSSTDAKWIIPVTLVCGSYDTREKFLLESEYETVDLLKLLKNKKDSIKFWIKVNVDQVGPYRVKYDDELFLRLRYAIEASQLSDADRFAILDDSFALCMAGRQTVSSLIKLIAAYEKELDPTVLTRMLTMIGSLHSIIAEARPDLVNETRQVLIDLLQFSAKRLGWESRDDESHLDAMVRAPLLGALIDLGHKITIDEAVRRFNAFMNDRSTPLLPPDIRKAAYAAVMKTVDASNRSGFESLLRLYRETDASEEKALVLGSLASGSDPSAVLGALNFVLSSEVRKQDVIFVPKGITRKGRDVAWKWLKDNWDHITKTWGAGSVLPRFIKGIVPLFASDESAKEIEEFVASRTLPSFSAAMKQNLETVRNSAKWARNIKCDESLGDTLQELAHSKNQCKVNDNH